MKNFSILKSTLLASVVCGTVFSMSAVAEESSGRLSITRKLSAEEEALRGQKITCSTVYTTPEIAEVVDGSLPEPGSGFGLSWKQITDAGLAKPNPNNKPRTWTIEITFGSTRYGNEMFNSYHYHETQASEWDRDTYSTWTVKTGSQGEKVVRIYSEYLPGDNLPNENDPSAMFTFSADTHSQVRTGQTVGHGHSFKNAKGESASNYYHQMEVKTCVLSN